MPYRRADAHGGRSASRDWAHGGSVATGGARRIGSGLAEPDYGAQMTALSLQALGADAKRIAAALKHELRPIGGASVE